MNEQLKSHLEFFEELGIEGVRLEPEWRTRREPIEPVEPIEPTERVPSEPTEPTEPTAPVERLALSSALHVIREDLGAECTRCKLHTLGRTQVVFGVGNPNADLMFVGEAPGADEDIQGEPFVGRAGQLLTKIIEAIDLRREDVYIANVIKCRPPGNRNPEPDEVLVCSPFLKRQIAAIRPKIVCCLGKFAAQTMLQRADPISRLRGEFHDIDGMRVIATFHPAYLLRSPEKKREVWEDMKQIRAELFRLRF